MHAKVAIITRTKNRPITLKRALDSVAGQTYRDYLHVIVNDGGETRCVDRLVEACGPEAGSKIHIIHNPVSAGMQAASNIGIKSCGSEYILIHDDDDSLMPDFLEKTVRCLEQRRSYGGVMTWLTRITEKIEGDEIIPVSDEVYCYSTMRGLSIGGMAVTNMMVPIGFLYRRSMHEQVGYYNESLPRKGDWEFYLRFLAKADVYMYCETLANYHIREEEEGEYSNSIINGIDEHIELTPVISNNMFRNTQNPVEAQIGFLSQVSDVIKKNMYIVSDTVGAMIKKPPAKETYAEQVLFQLQANKVTDAAIYGSGEIARYLVERLGFAGIKVSFIVENDPAKWGTAFSSVPVLALEEAIKQGCRSIIIGSVKYRHDIINRIHGQIDTEKENIKIFSAQVL